MRALTLMKDGTDVEAPSLLAPYLHIDGVSKDFRIGRETVTAVRDVTLGVGHGEFVAFIGHSGCGKSTVLNMVAGCIRRARGPSPLRDEQ